MSQENKHKIVLQHPDERNQKFHEWELKFYHTPQQATTVHLTGDDILTLALTILPLVGDVVEKARHKVGQARRQLRRINESGKKA